jgi:hypothetical protein
MTTKRTGWLRRAIDALDRVLTRPPDQQDAAGGPYPDPDEPGLDPEERRARRRVMLMNEAGKGPGAQSPGGSA